MVGYGTEIGSFFVGGGGAAKVGQQSLKGMSLKAMKDGLKYGSISGAMGLGGREMQDGDSSVGDVLLYTVLGGTSGAALGGLVGGLTPAAVKGVKTIIEPAAQKTKNVIREAIDKGIKPYFSSNLTPAVRKRYYKNAEEAFAIIHKYRPEIDDVEQGVSVDKLPESRAEMLDALTKTKQSIYKQYNDLSVGAGEKGAVFDATDAVSALDEVANSKKFTPEVRAYAESQKNIIQELHGEAPDVIEARIADLNLSSKAFFEGRVGTAKAQVDVSLASKMRESLDNIIEAATGEKYQVLKNQYGALRAIQKDLARQVALEARKNTKGFFDITDVFTGADLVQGVVTNDPTAFIRGAAGRGYKEWIKYLNNPNRYIRKGFEVLDNPPADIRKYIDKAYQYLKTHVGLSIEDVTKRPGYKPDDFKQGAVPQTADNLVQEAKKYKSADEFVKAKLDEKSFVTEKPIKVYRGEGKGIGNTTLTIGRYFADSKEFAENFGKVSESVIPSGRKVFDLDTIKSGSELVSPDALVNPAKLTDFLMDNGIEYTKNTNARGVEYVKLRRPTGSAKNRRDIERFTEFEDKFGGLADKYKSVGGFMNAMKKERTKHYDFQDRFDRITIDLDTNTSTPDMFKVFPTDNELKDFFRKYKSGKKPVIDKSSPDYEDVLETIWEEAKKK